jgi:hypothetical protein
LGHLKINALKIYQLQEVFNYSNCHPMQEFFPTKLIFQARYACTGLEYKFPEEPNAKYLGAEKTSEKNY